MTAQPPHITLGQMINPNNQNDMQSLIDKLILGLSGKEVDPNKIIIQFLKMHQNESIQQVIDELKQIENFLVKYKLSKNVQSVSQVIQQLPDMNIIRNQINQSQQSLQIQVQQLKYQKQQTIKSLQILCYKQYEIKQQQLQSIYRIVNQYLLNQKQIASCIEKNDINGAMQLIIENQQIVQKYRSTISFFNTQSTLSYDQQCALAKGVLLNNDKFFINCNNDVEKQQLFQLFCIVDCKTCLDVIQKQMKFTKEGFQTNLQNIRNLENLILEFSKQNAFSDVKEDVQSKLTAVKGTICNQFKHLFLAQEIQEAITGDAQASVFQTVSDIVCKFNAFQKQYAFDLRNNVMNCIAETLEDITLNVLKHNDEIFQYDFKDIHLINPVDQKLQFEVLEYKIDNGTCQSTFTMNQLQLVHNLINLSFICDGDKVLSEICKSLIIVISNISQKLLQIMRNSDVKINMKVSDVFDQILNQQLTASDAAPSQLNSEQLLKFITQQLRLTCTFLDLGLELDKYAKFLCSSDCDKQKFKQFSQNGTLQLILQKQHSILVAFCRFQIGKLFNFRQLDVVMKLDSNNAEMYFLNVFSIASTAINKIQNEALLSQGKRIVSNSIYLFKEQFCVIMNDVIIKQLLSQVQIQQIAAIILQYIAKTKERLGKLEFIWKNEQAIKIVQITQPQNKLQFVIDICQQLGTQIEHQKLISFIKNNSSLTDEQLQEIMKSMKK